MRGTRRHGSAALPRSVVVIATRCREMPRGCAAECPWRRTAARSCRSRPAPRPASCHGARASARNEQPRHLAVGIRSRSLLRTGLHALGGPQVDVDDDPGEIAGGRFGNFRGRDGVDLRRRTSGCWPVRCSDRRRSDASSNRRLDEVLLANAVMITLARGGDRHKRYLTKEFLAA